MVVRVVDSKGTDLFCTLASHEVMNLVALEALVKLRKCVYVNAQ